MCKSNCTNTILLYPPLILTCSHTKVFYCIIKHVQLSIGSTSSKSCFDHPALAFLTPCIWLKRVELYEVGMEVRVGVKVRGGMRMGIKLEVANRWGD